MAPFYGWNSTASSLQPLWGGSLLFTIQFPEIPMCVASWVHVWHRDLGDFHIVSNEDFGKRMVR